VQVRHLTLSAVARIARHPNKEGARGWTATLTEFHKAQFTYLDIPVSIIDLFYSTRFERDVFITHLMVTVEICSSQGSDWYVTAYFCGYVRFGGVFCLHLQGRCAACTIRCAWNFRRKLQIFSPKSYYIVINYYFGVFLLLVILQLTEYSETSKHNIQTPGNHALPPPKYNTTFRTLRKLDIKIIILFIIMAV
jgi:hypothetical protein